ncbi:peptide ABC transporter substrate-binding protein [Bifidobacterium leontopitheci]|uniref:ABC transporter substrate-binding protein n=1 Tax=Bifidobacterium leontopitheci TaxID=2650774 RepID=A0A6I1GM18_9BIFI|nr:ABC transporter substrate-binding protein [Bifidobacterium leontopitheci]KAB7790626.1 ABC transporter substrate-binding protein [Bifidobacterium leontopitheci]
MNLKKRIIASAAAVCAAAMLLSGCGSSNTTNSATGEDSVISYASIEPKSKLIPGDTNETPAAIVLRELFSGLVSYNQDGSTANEVAKSITANDDSSQYTIELNSGWKFTDGTPVTAESFAKAWSYTANATNAQIASSFFSSIKGYDDLQKKGVDKNAQLSGIDVQSDTKMVVTLNAPNSTFPTMLGYTAYMPLPESFYKDPSAFGEHPVGNGPYKFDSWEHNKYIKISRNKDYKGPRKVKNAGIEYRVYTDTAAAYADVQAGNLDLSGVPANAMKTFQTDSNVKAYSQPGSSIMFFTIPERLEHFGRNKEGNLRRQALSMAINRAQIAKKIFNGTRTPAVDFIAPSIPGYTDQLKGKTVFEYNPDEAKKLWDEANKISPWTGPLTFTYSADQSGYKETAEAIVNFWSQAFGVETKTVIVPTFTEMAEQMDTRKTSTPYMMGWSADYPAADDYLVQLYDSSTADGKGANYGDYKNPEFDAFMDKALASSDSETANKYYHEGEEILTQELPNVPLFYMNAIAVSTPNLKNVKFGYDNVPLLDQIQK